MVYPDISRGRLWRILMLSACLAATFAVDDRPSSAQTPEPRVVPIVARRFAFEPSKIEATVGERLQLVITSADGVHGVEIKKFKIKKEVPRGGEAVTIEFTATTEGSFPILCSEYCGNGHNDMTGMLIVRSAPDGSR
jgi:cytochrome c oxidase subunit 2